MHGFIVGPTVNPQLTPLLFKSTLLTKKLFPVRYFPTMLISPIFLSEGSEVKKFSASGFKQKPLFY